MIRRVLAIPEMALLLSVVSCTDTPLGTTEPPYPLPQTSEDYVLQNFIAAYRNREISHYTSLLAADFQFYLDPSTASRFGFSSLSRAQDSLATERLFSKPEVTRVVIELDWHPRSATDADLAPPRESWTRLHITDVFLDVDLTPTGQETTTYRVENQTQRFFFRRGRTNPPSGPADTLVYIVEWRDMGITGAGRAPLTSEPTSWSQIKTLFRP